MKTIRRQFTMTMCGAMLLVIAPKPGGAAPPKVRGTAAELLQVLESPDTTPTRRRQVETTLKKMSPMGVIPLLVPKISAGMPSSLVYSGSGTPEGDAKAPPAWRAFYSYHRVWEAVAAKDHKLAGFALLDRLKQCKSDYERCLLIRYLERFWVDDAELTIAKSLKTSGDTWMDAARCLMSHQGDRYHDEIKKALEDMPSLPWQAALRKARTIELLTSKRARLIHFRKQGRAKKVPPIDREVITIGFELLQVMRQYKKGFGYHHALRLGDYVDQKFQPNQKDAKYQTATGLAKSFFSDTVKNALDWWEKNKRVLVGDKQKDAKGR